MLRLFLAFISFFIFDLNAINYKKHSLEAGAAVGVGAISLPLYQMYKDNPQELLELSKKGALLGIGMYSAKAIYCNKDEIKQNFKKLKQFYSNFEWTNNINIIVFALSATTLGACAYVNYKS